MSEVNLALTVAGQGLMAKIAAGKGDIPLTITRIVTASGRSGEPLNLTDVVNKEQEFSITERSVLGFRTAITAILTNQGNAESGIPPLAKGYTMSQIGFYAIDPDEGEILYRISQFDMPNYVPAAKERAWTYTPTFNFVTGNASEVNVCVDYTGLVTADQLETVRDMAREAYEAAVGGGITLQFPDIGILKSGVVMRCVRSGLKWKPPFDESGEGNGGAEAAPPRPGLLSLDDGTTAEGFVITEEGELKKLLIVEERV